MSQLNFTHMAAILPSPRCLTSHTALCGRGIHSFQRQEVCALNALQNGSSGALSATGGTRWAGLLYKGLWRRKAKDGTKGVSDCLPKCARWCVWQEWFTVDYHCSLIHIANRIKGNNSRGVSSWDIWSLREKRAFRKGIYLWKDSSSWPETWELDSKV